MNFKHHSKFFRLSVIWRYKFKPWPHSNFENLVGLKKRGLHFVYLNINSLPSKIEELRQTAKDTNAAVTGLSETKLDKTLFDSGISTPNYSRKDRNRKGRGVVYYIRSNICFNSKNYLSGEIKNISFDLLLLKIKPISIAIVYRLPTDNHFLDYLPKGLNNFNLMENGIFILGDTNINILINGENILDKYKGMSKRKSDFGAIPKKFAQICSTLGLKQLINHHTRITGHTSTFVDHINRNCEEKCTQSVVIDISLSDHQLIFFALGKPRE